MVKKLKSSKEEMLPGVMLVRKHEDGSSHWRVACDCMANEHDAELWIDAEKDWPMLDLTLTMEIGVYPQYREGIRAWFEDKLERIIHAAKVLFTGYATMRGEVILNEDGVKALQTALEEGVKFIKDDKARAVAEKWYGKEKA